MIPDAVGPWITDRECHHLAMGDLRFRCIEFSNTDNQNVVLCCEHREPLVAAASPEFSSLIKTYMDSLLLKHLILYGNCFVAQCDVTPPQILHYSKVQNGIAKRRVYVADFRQLFEGGV